MGDGRSSSPTIPRDGRIDTNQSIRSQADEPILLFTAWARGWKPDLQAIPARPLADDRSRHHVLSDRVMTVHAQQ